MKNLKSKLVCLALGFGLGLGAPKFVNWVRTNASPEPEITKGAHQGFNVEVRKEKYRSVIILERGRTRIHGIDYSNDGSVNMAEPIMGYVGTTNNQRLIQEAYDSLRNK